MKRGFALIGPPRVASRPIERISNTDRTLTLLLLSPTTTKRMKSIVFHTFITAALLATTVAADTKTNLPKVYTYSNATSFAPEGSPFITFMFDLPMYASFNEGSATTDAPLSSEVGVERGWCNMQPDIGLIVCNIVQVFDDGQIMLQGTGNAAEACTLHAIVGGTGAYAGLSGSANECEQENDVVLFQYELTVKEDESAASAGIVGYYSNIMMMLAFVALAVAS